MKTRVKNVRQLCTEEKFCDTYHEVIAQIDACSRRMRPGNAWLQDYAGEETIGNDEMNKHGCGDFVVARGIVSSMK